MKTLEVEAAIDTAEETRKKIVELTSEKQKEVEDQVINRLMAKHNTRPGDLEDKEEEKAAEERIKKARKDRNEFFFKDNEKKDDNYSDTSEFESDESGADSGTEASDQTYSLASDQGKRPARRSSVVEKETKENKKEAKETRETQYSPDESFVSLHEKYEAGRGAVQVQSVETQVERGAGQEAGLGVTWFPGINSPTKPGISSPVILSS